MQPAQVRQEDDESQVGRAPEGQVLASQAADRDQRGQQSGQDELLLHQLQGSSNSSMSFKFSKPHNSGDNLETWSLERLNTISVLSAPSFVELTAIGLPCVSYSTKERILCF